MLQAIETRGPNLAGMGPLIIESDLIVVGQVVNEQARLSPDTSTVLTDYTIEVGEVLVDPGHRSAPGQRLRATRTGGQMRLGGVAVHIESVDFPPLAWLTPHVFFLKADAEGYRFWGGAQGVWEVRDGRVWSHLPEEFGHLPLRRLYQRYKAEAFFRWVRGTGTPPQ